jgi:biotin carboxyl carrier protein
MEDLILAINDNEYGARFDRDDFSKIYINDSPVNVELLKKYHDNIFSFSVNQKLVQVELDMDPSGRVTISLDGINYEIEVSSETRRMLEKYLIDAGMDSAASAGRIAAPMPGMVVKVMVGEGDSVAKGDKVVIVEAMKMENALKSPIDGTVKQVAVSAGQPVDKDALLVEIEPK